MRRGEGGRERGEEGEREGESEVGGGEREGESQVGRERGRERARWELVKSACALTTIN